ncbi:MAG: hypothetical protein SLAVMIC_00712 [uncultured marine phage]|uniref:Uncharacterized protein n=1 Tax=uncultured marine phage TaxID=707152 RepID=A0A8D9CDI2_9VIRU|nr:MAG: hypothetical protein SLAVMIC_00712 [uncultured marine phage]
MGELSKEIPEEFLETFKERFKNSIMQNAHQHWLKANTTLDFEDWIKENEKFNTDGKPNLGSKPE